MENLSKKLNEGVKSFHPNVQLDYMLSYVVIQIVLFDSLKKNHLDSIFNGKRC
jgi:hypothetical protein